jgi:hypothetical protein
MYNLCLMKGQYENTYWRYRVGDIDWVDETQDKEE